MACSARRLRKEPQNTGNSARQIGVSVFLRFILTYTSIPLHQQIAVLAHGDYCDKSNYITKWVDFTHDKAALCKFVNGVSSTGGGDWEECYELVLHQVGSLDGEAS